MTSIGNEPGPPLGSSEPLTTKYTYVYQPGTLVNIYLLK